MIFLPPSSCCSPPRFASQSPICFLAKARRWESEAGGMKQESRGGFYRKVFYTFLYRKKPSSNLTERRIQ
ncbi:TPA: hypothetical protein DEW49_03830 [bacterium]|uniref:Uncharacterized protein n=1 Tax=bacterium (Candidatus Ratteibacteria) CG15_BIG_FIL_POST_REV_8_21_14_020_41_12 TaxID=2014291 RepID=A0A2M7GZ79_9BACT|nr:MAG: hypothetical protein COW28_02835 [bacterium (Candidatus Ratteibacteria) CG15_BIG_FIL_POST_REV_8_21_14_020_41_12]HCG77011.1 hypothetical protein [bacterium]